MPNGCISPIPMDLVGTASAIQHIKTKLSHFFFFPGACAFSGSGQGGIEISGGDGQGKLTSLQDPDKEGRLKRLECLI